ncbi:hypothetical protein KKH18_06790, partial [bacterium]|nr:hypothetical protein [bacterium]
VGFGVELAKDISNAKEHRVNRSNIRKLPYKREIQIVCVNGDTLLGVFKGVENYSDTLYLPEEGQAIKGSSSLLPCTGDTIVISGFENHSSRCVFTGLNSGWIHYQRNGNDYRMALNTVCRVSDLHGNDYNHNLWSGETVDRYQAKRKYVINRSIDYLILEKENANQRIPLQNIDLVYAPPKTTNYWALGLGVGAAADALMVALFFAAMSNMELNFDIDMGNGYGGNGWSSGGY